MRQKKNESHVSAHHHFAPRHLWIKKRKTSFWLKNFKRFKSVSLRLKTGWKASILGSTSLAGGKKSIISAEETFILGCDSVWWWWWWCWCWWWGGGPSQIPPHIEDQWQEHVDLSGLLLASRQCQSKKTLSGATKTTRCTWDEFEQIDLSYTKQSHCFYIWCVCFQSALTVDDL